MFGGKFKITKNQPYTIFKRRQEHLILKQQPLLSSTIQDQLYHTSEPNGKRNANEGERF